MHGTDTTVHGVKSAVVELNYFPVRVPKKYEIENIFSV